MSDGLLEASATESQMQAHKALAEERRFTEAVLDTLDALVAVLDDRGHIVRVNRACQRMTGFSPGELEGRPIWDAFSLPEDVELFRVVFQRLRDGVSPIDYENSVLTKGSEQRRIAWSCATVSCPDESNGTMIATGIDVTKWRMPQPKDPGAPAGEGTWEEAVSTILLTHGERRQWPRRSYPYKQSIAPIVDGKLPEANRFESVQCNDIAAGGFSYLSPTPPESDEIVVELGTGPKLTYITAQVMHITRRKRQGGHVYLIGCRYTGRAKY